MRFNRARRSASDSDKHKMAMTSEAAVMSKPEALSVLPPRLTVICRRARSFMSSTRFHSTRSGARREVPLNK